MAEQHLEAGGQIVSPDTLKIPRASQLADLLARERLCYVTLVECRSGGGEKQTETVLMDVEVERPRDLAHPILRFERVAAIFSAEDNWYPEVLALRADFPRVPHLNLRGTEFPRSLCLYDRPWPEVAIRWTPAGFVERVRFWLAETAKGTLHQADQPLEPLLFGHGWRIVLPADLFADIDKGPPVRLDVRLASRSDQCRTLIAERPSEQAEGKEPPKFVATAFVAEAQPHGLIRRSPTNLAELHDFLLAGKLDMLSELRTLLKGWDSPALAGALPIFVVALPLTREAAGSVEACDIWAFLTPKNVGDVRVGTGIADRLDGRVVPLIEINADRCGRDIPIDAIQPILAFSRASAARANGVEPDPRKVVAVGAGALGSQVISLLARSGFGNWTIVDEDDLLPHNLARHALDDCCIGHPKAFGMAVQLHHLYSEGDGSGFIPADYLAPGPWEESLQKALAGAELILDMATSVPVARRIASADCSGRRVSVFLNPLGSDLVVLAEDKGRTRPLDALEGQYYRAAAQDQRLKGHLEANKGSLRYGRSCRNVTAVMPGHLVTMHAAIASEAVRRALASDEASIRVWRCDRQGLSVTPVEVPVNATQKRDIGGWFLVLDDGLLAKLAALRSAKLPDETGGVLIGTFDLEEMVVHVLDTIPSPPDSKEWPTLYIRGSEGLLKNVNQIFEASGGQLEYVGEWHSHPDDCPTLPSEDDLKVFTWLTEHMSDAGLPALMAIVGDRSGSSWYLGEMLRTGGWGVTA
ncbi:MAG: Mov34/MPN/PAD-1 family protein [Gemmataceae bacterium]|nr:Mov34/MPN/PAD-1 family protein [Gemmataceae bacterium]